ncbi:MAG: 50S ribosomal protein L16 [Nanoarchaeota archaeon]
MAKVRKFCAYRRLERPYTRKSKYRKLSYIKTNPNIKIVKFETGNLSRKFPVRVDLISKDNLQIRHNAFESARLTSNRTLEKGLGKKEFKFKIRVFPHHFLRENPLASGAGADRMSTGMKMSFGKVIGSAAQIKKDQIVLSVFVEKNKIAVARKALKKASYKMPAQFSLSVTNIINE